MRAPVIARAPLKFVVPEFVIVKSVRLVELPDPIAARFTVPVPAFRVKVSAEPPAVPSRAPETVMAPAPTEPWVESVTVVPSAKVKELPILKRVLVVVILEAKFTAPLVENPPGAVILPVEFLVKVPEFVTLIAPVEVRLLFTAKVVPFKVAEPTLVVDPKVVAPVAALV